MRHFPLFFILLLCTCGPAPSCQAQVPDTLITVTTAAGSRVANLPYPEARIFAPHHRLREADLATLTKSHKKDWLKYLPSVSAGLAPSFRQNNDGSVRVGLAPTPSVGLNSSLIYQAHRAGQQPKLHRLQRRLQIETDKLNLHVGVTDIDRQLFNLYQQQYDNHDITPEEYLLKRKAFLLQELRNQDQITRIEALQYEIEDLAGCLSLPYSQDELPSRK